MIELKDFLTRLRDETPLAASSTQQSATSAPVKKGFSRPQTAIDAARQKPATHAAAGETFVSRLLSASGFGESQNIPREAVLPKMGLSGRYVPKEIRYFKPDGTRQHHVVLIELDVDGRELLQNAKTLFGKERALDLLEDVLDRIAQEVLRSFEKEKSDDQIPRAKQYETLSVLSVADHRVKGTKNNRLVHFSTEGTSKREDLESFTIRQECVDWSDEVRSNEYVERVYKRSFRWLDGSDWKRAFVREAERTKIRKLAEACSAKGGVDRNVLERHVVDLLDEVAGSFGLVKNKGRCVTDTQLPVEHDIGRSAGKTSKRAWKAPPGVVIRDQEQHLLGYIVYCLDGAKEAQKFEERLAENNRFHNVLVLYPDGGGVSVSLWQGAEAMRGKLTKAGSVFKEESRVINFLSRFFIISRAEIDTPKQLAEELAHRARFLHDVVRAELDREEKLNAGEEKPRILPLFNDFNSALGSFSKDEFANAYAETITYGLLSARWMARDATARFFLTGVSEQLPSTSPFLHSLFARLIDLPIGGRFTWLLSDIASLLDRTSVREVFASADEQEDHSDPVIHFYEDFLDAYDPERRQKKGVYYTPSDVVSCMVECAHSILIDEFKLPDGLADTSTWAQVAALNGFTVPKGINPEAPFVCILDPATGTGTFLKKVIEVIHRTVTAKYVGSSDEVRAKAWIDYVRASLLPRVNGFELLMAPYIVAHLRLGLALEETGFSFGGNDRLRVYLTNTLEAPAQRQLDLVAKDVALESREADALKSDVPVTVIIGNPPYDREEGKDGEHDGGWVRDGWDGWREQRPLLSDYVEPVQQAGMGGHLKNIYNLYIYFWRWATWRALERYRIPGLVAFITPASFLSGKGFVGVRQSMRSLANAINVLDLEGDQLGTRKTPNVFAITTPVCVTWIRRSSCDVEQLTPHYFCVTGTREVKLSKCARMRVLSEFQWDPCGSAANDPFLPRKGQDYTEFPLLTDVFPWQHSGSQFKRNWPIETNAETLVRRWRELLRVSSTRRAELFRETRDRSIDRSYPDLLDDETKLQAIAELSPRASMLPIERYSFRSFDRQWCFLDSRLGDFMRPTLWRTRSPQQVFLTGLMTVTLGTGVGLTATAHVPDLHHFRGSFGGKDAIPLWRDPSAATPNINNAGLRILRDGLGYSLRVPDLFAYAYAIMAHPGYVARFHEELRTPGPRLPITKRVELFERGVALGAELLRLHTFGERFRADGDGFTLAGAAKVVMPIPGDEAHYPERYKYDEKSSTLRVGDGAVSPVSKDVWEYAASGFKVVDSWLAYRMKAGAGKKSSDLDDIRPERWTSEMTMELLEVLWVLERSIAMHPQLDAFLGDVLAGETFTAKELPPPTEAEKKEPKIETRQMRLM